MGDSFEFSVDVKSKKYYFIIDNESDYSVNEVLIHSPFDSNTTFNKVVYTRNYEEQEISESMIFLMKPNKKVYSIFGSRDNKIENFVLVIKRADNDKYISCKIELSGYEDAIDMQWDTTNIRMEVHIIVNNSVFERLNHITSYKDIINITLSLNCVDGFYIRGSEIKILDPEIVDIIYNGMVYNVYDCIFMHCENIDEFENHHICSGDDDKEKLHLPHSLLVKNYSLFIKKI